MPEEVLRKGKCPILNFLRSFSSTEVTIVRHITILQYYYITMGAELLDDSSRAGPSSRCNVQWQHPRLAPDVACHQVRLSRCAPLQRGRDWCFRVWYLSPGARPKVFLSRLPQRLYNKSFLIKVSTNIVKSWGG